ncbi:MAG: hypothetical protein DSY82_07465 [Flavobacteriia bacterium]|nr:MAG: hypothetical protein DSY82_07465 [Flavobacteriia bacterium]
MKLKFNLIVFLLISNSVFSQKTVKMTCNYGSNNKDIQELTVFEGIFIEQLNFEGENLNGKSYIIKIIEFKEGKKINSSTLFDGTESDYFRINSGSVSLKFFFKLNDGELKVQIRGNNFFSKKTYFKLYDDVYQYALKDFFSYKSELNIDLSKTNAVLAIITPSIHKDGTGSYCEVVQTDVAPEELGAHFKIPHYFIVTIEFK